MLQMVIPYREERSTELEEMVVNKFCRICDTNLEALELCWKARAKLISFGQGGTHFHSLVLQLAAERKFGVNEQLLRDWQKAEITLTALKKMKNRNRMMWNDIGKYSSELLVGILYIFVLLVTQQ